MSILDKKARKNDESLWLVTNADGTQEIVAEAEKAGRGGFAPAWGQTYREILASFVKSFEQTSCHWLKFHEKYMKGRDIPDLGYHGATYRKHEAVHFVAKGQAYSAYIGTDHKGSFLGFDGQRVAITLDSGETIESNNLWGVGTVPVYLREVLRDNAAIKWHQ